jgi:ribonuclease HII
MENISYENFKEEALSGFKVNELKKFIKLKGLKKPGKITRKADIIKFLVKEKDVVFGLKEQEIPIPRLEVERTKVYSLEDVIVGIDEAGQGCCAGDLFIGIVILPKTHDDPLWGYITDSKKLSKSRRAILREYVKKIAIEYVVHRVTPEEIDTLNVLQAKLKGFHDGLNKLQTNFDKILMDGDKFKKYKDVSHECVIKGDSIYKSIAAASILAKTERDEYMETLALECPNYNWENNKGYCTKDHEDAIRKHGVTKYHRMSYKTCHPN